MTTHDDIRAICSRLPGSIEGVGRFGFSVMVKGKAKGFAWTWAERVHPKRPKVINDRVLAISVPNLEAKDLLLASEPGFLFTEPHYDGFPAVLARLDDATPEQIEELLIEAWRCKAPPALIEAFDLGR
ncbi:MAG: hypothetical protein AMXMBFR81_06910 [Chthonomonas sp.]|nr:hypothetical protein [Fimbriimonadaceae bacterium]